MNKAIQYAGLDIRTREGKLIYDAAHTKAIFLGDKRDREKFGSKKWKRWDTARMKALSDGLKEAHALNPKPRKIKKKQTPIRRRAKRT
jgi:hypothetical protein